MRRATIAFALVAASALITTACVKQEVVRGSNVGPALVVEQFLRAANDKDLQRMGQLFGTKDGPIANRDPRDQVEQRMFAIASVLRHEDFELESEQQVPGRTADAIQLTVKLTISGALYRVPFTVVRFKEQSFLVEQIGIEVITNRPR